MRAASKIARACGRTQRQFALCRRYDQLAAPVPVDVEWEADLMEIAMNTDARARRCPWSRGGVVSCISLKTRGGGDWSADSGTTMNTDWRAWNCAGQKEIGQPLVRRTKLNFTQTTSICSISNPCFPSLPLFLRKATLELPLDNGVRHSSGHVAGCGVVRHGGRAAAKGIPVKQQAALNPRGTLGFYTR